MSNQDNAPNIKRILVALDASPSSRAALRAAMELAVRFGAELSGLFVEDQNLLRLSSYAFVQEIGLYTATSRRIEEKEIEREVRVQSRRVQRIFTLTTERAHLSSSFRIVRGVVLSEVLNAAKDADVLVLGKLGWSLLRHDRLGSTVRGLLPERSGLTLIMEPNTCLGAPMAVVYDGTSVGDRALLTTLSINDHLDESPALIVLLISPDPAQSHELKKQASRILSNQKRMARYRVLTRTNALQIASILQEEVCGTLVLPVRSAAFQNEALEVLMENVNLPMLLVT